jgi:hypothetical protein
MLARIVVVKGGAADPGSGGHIVDGDILEIPLLHQLPEGGGNGRSGLGDSGIFAGHSASAPLRGIAAGTPRQLKYSQVHSKCQYEDFPKNKLLGLGKMH